MGFEKEIEELRNSFVGQARSVDEKHKRLIADNAAAMEKWTQDWEQKQIAKKMPAILKSVKSRYFVSKIKKYIYDVQLEEDGVLPDFDKMMYCIELLNATKPKRKIRKYNSRYCDGLLQTVAKEYKKSQNWLRIEKRRREKLEEEAYATGASELKNAWNKYNDITLSMLARKMAKSIRESLK